MIKLQSKIAQVDDFEVLPPVFIISYHRADRLLSVGTFKRLGYPADLLHVVIDDEGGDEDAYRAVCAAEGVNLHVFSQRDARDNYDYVLRPQAARRSGGQARNQIWRIAERLEVRQFIIVDDDTVDFRWRPYALSLGEDSRITPQQFRTGVLSLACFQREHRIALVAISQGGEMLEHAGQTQVLMIRRKAMNFCMYLTDLVHGGERGQLDEDTTQYVTAGGRGLLVLAMRSGFMLQQPPSLGAKGGATDLYMNSGMISKVACDMIQTPSAVRGEIIHSMGDKLHHRIYNRYLYPYLLKRPAGEGNNIAWDTYPEDVPFTNVPARKWYYVE